MATIPGNKDTYLCSDSLDDNGFLFHPYRSSLVYLPGNVPSLIGGRCFRCTCRTAPHLSLIHIFATHFQRGLHSGLDLLMDPDLQAYDSLLTLSLRANNIFLPHRTEFLHSGSNIDSTPVSYTHLFVINTINISIQAILRLCT